jgi:hypothetical protein
MNIPMKRKLIEAYKSMANEVDYEQDRKGKYAKKLNKIFETTHADNIKRQMIF